MLRRQGGSDGEEGNCLLHRDGQGRWIYAMYSCFSNFLSLFSSLIIFTIRLITESLQCSSSLRLRAFVSGFRDKKKGFWVLIYLMRSSNVFVLSTIAVFVSILKYHMHGS